MGRYIYMPIDYQEYLSKYINTLKTGELLVDLSNHDIYVTEEGYNVPIPKTKELRETISDFLENDLEGINLRKVNSAKLVNNLNNIRSSIVEQQNQIYETVENLNGTLIDFNNRSTFVNKVNQNNINQLGDLSIDVTNIPIYKDEIQSIVNEFNRINSNSLSAYYSSDAANHNTYLLSLWNQLTSLMNAVNGKVTSLEPFSGTGTLQKNVTTTVTAYDCTYEDHLQQFSSWYSSPRVGYDTGSFNNDQLVIQSSQLLVPHFNTWFLNGSSDDGSGARIGWLYNYGQIGTGLWYKNFPAKINLNTGTTASQRYPAWDLFETVPLVAQYNGTGSGEGKFFTPSYYWSATNHFCFYDGDGNSSKFSTTLRGNHYTGGTRYSSSQHDPLPSRWTGNTTDSLMNTISTINSSGLQRIPKYTTGNSTLSIAGKSYHTFSPVQASIPVTSYRNWYYSNTGILNKDKIVFRCGIYKKVNQTVISTRTVNWDDSTNKWT